MIAEKCFTQEWISAKALELRYPDKNVIERVVRAFSLLDMLARSGCPFVFKGGTSLMLLLQDTGCRLSTDIDIICPPETNIEGYLQEYQQNGFIRYELVERRQEGTSIPKGHSKLFYYVAFPHKDNEDMYILLDVLYDECHYVQTKELNVLSPLIEIVGKPAKVHVPSEMDILGDKLTAFAPDTTGIPYYKKGDEKSLEVVKQLYDVGRLFERVDDLDVTASVFRSLVPVELAYRGLDMSVEEVTESIRQTDINIGLRGLLDADKFAFMQRGILKLRNYMYEGRQYRIDEAIIDSARDAYLVTMIEKGKTVMDKYPGEPTVVAKMELGEKLPARLSKLRKNFPEAYWYWCKVGELLLEN